MKTLYCIACGKSQNEVRLLVSLLSSPKDQLICNECVDLCFEIVHESEGYTKIALSELETLRDQALQLTLARIWIDGVRKYVAVANEQIQPVKA